MGASPSALPSALRSLASKPPLVVVAVAPSAVAGRPEGRPSAGGRGAGPAGGCSAARSGWRFVPRKPDATPAFEVGLQRRRRARGQPEAYPAEDRRPAAGVHKVELHRGGLRLDLFAPRPARGVHAYDRVPAIRRAIADDRATSGWSTSHPGRPAERAGLRGGLRRTGRFGPDVEAHVPPSRPAPPTCPSAVGSWMLSGDLGLVVMTIKPGRPPRTSRPASASLKRRSPRPHRVRQRQAGVVGVLKRWKPHPRAGHHGLPRSPSSATTPSLKMLGRHSPGETRSFVLAARPSGGGQPPELFPGARFQAVGKRAERRLW